MGFQGLGLEARASNIATGHYIKANTNLPTLQFAQDDVWNIGQYGTFDGSSVAAFCIISIGPGSSCRCCPA
jgi:hypothetical protein